VSDKKNEKQSQSIRLCSGHVSKWVKGKAFNDRSFMLT